MRPISSVLMALVVTAGTAPGVMAKQAPAVDLVLQPVLESERATYAAQVQEAAHDVVDNFTQWGFHLEPGSLVRKVHVFADLPTARTTIAKIFGAKPEDLPETFGGLATSDQFFLASPALYRKTHDKLYGAATWDDRTYHRLMVHELSHTAHALYAARVLGDEEKMGPGWFFEGFACYSAGQFSKEPALSKAEFTRLLAEVRQGKKAGYPAFARMVSTLAARVPVPELLRHAGDPNFPDSILESW